MTFQKFTIACLAFAVLYPLIWIGASLSDIASSLRWFVDLKRDPVRAKENPLLGD